VSCGVPCARVCLCVFMRALQVGKKAGRTLGRGFAFVGFYCRVDAEKALKFGNGKEVRVVAAPLVFLYLCPSVVAGSPDCSGLVTS
jgi:hypothetical protein